VIDDFFSSVPVPVLVALVATFALLIWMAIRENRRYRSPEAVAARAEKRDQYRAALALGDEHTVGEWIAGALVFAVAAPVVGGLAFVIGLFGTQFIEWFFAFWEPLVVVLSWIAWIFVGMIALGFTMQAASSVMDSITTHRLQHGKKKEVA